MPAEAEIHRVAAAAAMLALVRLMSVRPLGEREMERERDRDGERECDRDPECGWEGECDRECGCDRVGERD